MRRGPAAGGFVALLDAIAEPGRGAGLDEAGALAIYAPLVRRASANAERLGIAVALTGPSCAATSAPSARTCWR
jgi:predicted short-subunit dehydrogenase-like oxidoreductase (DUF2520 family)